ncbi:trypsin-like peptidase domain-containing protein [Stenotrophomonas maltophilia]|uniref:trypsin-like peptidase domain-containing protein n=1 Tax=Stenotrophomonas maltophilia TaxID=40324 RepID=UPI0012DB6510|nr:trypsin-like peptidase domain-containing protein [Stenotrophomonas maltophilia]
MAWIGLLVSVRENGGEPSLVPNDERKNVRAIEPIMMIGYPNGLWGEHNNRPLARRGSTASHPFLKWNGRQEFVIDAACFPGSSGSPVFLFEDIMFRTKDNSYTPGARAQLLGVLASGPLFTNEGTLVRRDIPTATTMVPVVSSMMNLGNVVHADALQKVIDLASAATVEGRTFARAISV